MPSTEQILTFFKEQVGHPTTARELARLLRVPRDERVAFKRDLKRLVVSGRLAQVRGNRFALPDADNLVAGRLHTNPGGFGFVNPDDASAGLGSSERSESRGRDIYIAAANLSEAMHGDRVLVRVERQTPRGLEGRIVLIIERANDTVVGRFETDAAGLAYVVPFDRRITADIHVPSGEGGAAEPADMVVIQITRWPTATRGPVGRIVEVLGNIDERGVDTQIIIR
jgi:ribonuclease R